MRATALIVLLAGAASPAAQAAEPVSYYNQGTAARERGEHQASKEAFLKLLGEKPDSGGALEGLALACLKLGQYEEARGYAERWSKQAPGNPYILGLLARADRGLREWKALAGDYQEIAAADPEDIPIRQKLDDLMFSHESGVFPSGRFSKSLSSEGLGTSSPQRIVYEGRRGGVRGRVSAPLPGLSVTGGAEVSQTAQRNDTRGFTYFDILEQAYSFGFEERPNKNFLFAAEYGQSLLSDNKASGIGRVDFSRAQARTELRAFDADFRLTAERAPKFLRGAGGSRFFALLRSASARAEIESYRWSWGVLARAGIYHYSERTTQRSWSLLGTKELWGGVFQPVYNRSQQEFYGASSAGRLQAVDYDRIGFRARRRSEDVYQAAVSYGHSLYRDANRVHDASADLTLWVPKRRSLSAAYRFSIAEYKAIADNYRSTDSREHWFGVYWRPRAAPGLWPLLGAERGLINDNRGSYDGQALLGELECYHKGSASIKMQGRLGTDTFDEEHYSLALQARYSFR